MSLQIPAFTRRGIVVLAAAALAALLAFVALTAIGVGGGEDHSQRLHVTSFAEEEHISSKAKRYSQRIAQQEGNVAAGSPPNPEDQPISPQKFRGPIDAYRAYAERQLTVLTRQLQTLGADLRTGDRAASKQAWLAAFTRYLRLGAVYGLFPTLDGEIDGTASTLPRGVRDPHFTGLHKLEYGLWRGAAPASLLPSLRLLETDVQRLRGVVETVRITPKEYARRAHEILEDAQRDFLSGDAVPYSGDGVAATAAAVVATETVLATMRRLLHGQSAVGPVGYYLAQLKRVLRRLRARHHGSWPTVSQLTQYENEQLDGTLSATLQALSAIPEQLAVHLPEPIPTLREQQREQRQGQQG
ncbi:MAG TPA: EfeM/EfeO family lipoprotein [Solirubrobacteraceae bacterium]|jgi:iron uptake system EfeUOB component EfeO/EfeM